MSKNRLQPGHLLTRQERYALRLEIQDLKRQLDRAQTDEERERCERLLRNVMSEQKNDRESRPKKNAKRKGYL